MSLLRSLAGKKLMAAQLALLASALALILFYVTHNAGVFFNLVFLFFAGMELSCMFPSYMHSHDSVE
jgi:hypothetical protein